MSARIISSTFQTRIHLIIRATFAYLQYVCMSPFPFKVTVPLRGLTQCPLPCSTRDSIVDGEIWILFFCPDDSIRAAVLTVSPLVVIFPKYILCEDHFSRITKIQHKIRIVCILTTIEIGTCLLSRLQPLQARCANRSACRGPQYLDLISIPVSGALPSLYLDKLARNSTF